MALALTQKPIAGLPNAPQSRWGRVVGKVQRPTQAPGRLLLQFEVGVEPVVLRQGSMMAPGFPGWQGGGGSPTFAVPHSFPLLSILEHSAVLRG